MPSFLILDMVVDKVIFKLYLVKYRTLYIFSAFGD